MKQSWPGPPYLERTFESLEGEVSIVGRAHAPNNATREQVQYDREVEPAFVGADVRDVARPDEVGGRWVEFSIEYVGRNRECMTRISRAAERSLPAPFQPIFAHDALDSFSADAHALRLQLPMNARTAIDAAIASMGGANPDCELRVGFATRRRRSFLPSVETAARDAECSAE